MNKLIVLISALCALSIGSYYYVSAPISGLKIAVLLPAIHPAMDEIERGFKETMRNCRQLYTIKTFNACGNKTLLRSQAEEIAHGNYDLVFTVGTLSSHIFHTLKMQRLLTTPLVFCAVDNPESIGVTDPARKAGDQTTGVYIIDDFDAQCRYLKKIKHDAQSMLFVYDPTHGTNMQNAVNALQKAALNVGIHCITAQVFASNEIQQKVEPLLSDVDVVFIYTDHTTVSAVDTLIKLCNQYSVTLYASDLNSGQKGAALAFGVQEYDHGKEAALKALAILDEYQRAQAVAITPVSNYTLLLNKRTMATQGLPYTDNQLKELAQDPRIIIKEQL